MEAINNTATSTITSGNLLEILRQNHQVMTENGELLTILSVMNFHAGQRREEEIANANPSQPTVKAYVMTHEKGPVICNVIYAEGEFVLTHVEKLESTTGFFAQICREVDRSAEGNAFLMSAWSMV